MLIVMCRKIESVTIFRIIKTIDPDALVTQANVNGVYGQGFDQLKVKMKEEYRPNLETTSLHEKIEADTTVDIGGGHGARNQHNDIDADLKTFTGQPSSRI